MRKFFALLLLCFCTFLPCLTINAADTNVYFFDDQYENGLPDGYSGSGVWDYENKACVINGTGADITQMDRVMSVKGEIVTLSATFVLSGTKNMQMRFYDGTTLFQQMHLNPNSQTILVRQESGYREACRNEGKYLTETEYTLEIEINLESDTGKMRVTKNDGTWGEWSDIPIIASVSQVTKWNWIYAGSSTGSKTTIKRMAAWKVEDILTNEEAVEYVKNSLLLGNLNNICSDIALPCAGPYNTVISWSSDSPYISDSGEYTMPPFDEPVTVNLTASISLGEANAQKTFSATLYGENGIKAVKDRDMLFIPSSEKVFGNISLPKQGKNGSSIVWTSSRPDVIAPDGTVTRQMADTKVTLTATFTSAVFSVTRDFEINVIGMASVVEDSGNKISERDIYNVPLQPSYSCTGCGIVNDTFFLQRVDNSGRVSMQKQFDPRPGYIAYVEIEFSVQGEKNKVVQMQLLGSGSAAQENIEILSSQLRIGEGFLEKSGLDESYSKLGNNQILAGEKNVLRWEVNMYTHTVSTFLNSVCIAADRNINSQIEDVSKLYFPQTSEQFPSGIFIYCLESGYCRNYREELDADADALTLAAQATEDITVEVKGSRYNSDIEWFSNSPNARYENGKFYITRPGCDETDVTLTVTAKLTNNGMIKTKSFSLTVPKEKSAQAALDAAEEALNETYIKNMNDSLNDVRTDLKMPTQWIEGTTILWESSQIDVIDNEGRLERRFFSGRSLNITLTATIKKNEEERIKIFTATVNNPGYDSLIADKVVTASSVSGANLASFAVDFDQSTAWKPQRGDKNPHIDIDLGSLQWINRAEINVTGNAKYSLMGSVNASNWQSIRMGNSGEVVFTPVEIRYVRLVLLSENPERGVSEFKICRLYNDELCVILDSLGVDFSDKSNVTESFTLPEFAGEYGSTAIWSSGNPEVISDSGAVTRPIRDTTVTMALTVKKGEQSKTLIYNIRVLGTNNGGGTIGGGSGGSFIGKQRPSESGSGIPATPTEKEFNDLPSNHWSKEAVLSLYNKGIINGYSDGTFRPEKHVTRAEFVKLLCRALKIPDSQSQFSDVSSGDWYAQPIGSAASAGIINGYADGTFRPNDEISRQDMAVMTNRAIDFTKTTIVMGSRALFSDEGAIAQYALSSVKRLSEASLINGTDSGEFLPLSATTRAQAAQIVYKILKIRGEI